MKDEEMAEEYANNIDYTKTVKIFDCVPYHENCDVADMVAQAFLAGLKAGRPQWHDLEEDPNDLPPRMGLGSEEVYVQYDAKGVTDFACYRFDKNIWERSEDDDQAVGVIAWCEIPTFDKE